MIASCKKAKELFEQQGALYKLYHPQVPKFLGVL